MPSKKKKYNARFPAGRIKKIMQTDEEIGKVAQAVPVIISKTLELFVEELISKTIKITTMKNARTLSPHHMKQCILSESRFDFLKDLVKSVPEVANSDDDIGSFSDNSTTLPLRQRSNSKDTNMRLAENVVTGPSVNTETEAHRDSESEALLLKRDSSDSDSDDDVEMSINFQDHSKETVPQESVNSFAFPAKKENSDSEDYDT